VHGVRVTVPRTTLQVSLSYQGGDQQVGTVPLEDVDEIKARRLNLKILVLILGTAAATTFISSLTAWDSVSNGVLS